MKKQICVLLVLCMVLAAVACQPSNTTTGATTPVSTATPPSAAPAQPAPADPENPTMEQLLAMDWSKIEEYAKKEGTLTFWTWHDEDFWQKLGTAFTEKYGVKVELLVSEKAPAIDKALAEKDGAVGSFDVMKVGGDQTLTTIMAGLYAGPILEKMRAKDLLDPGLSVVQEGVFHEGYLVPLHLNQTGLLYNPRTVTNPPQTFEELEKWIEANPMKFGFCPPNSGGSGHSMVTAVIEHKTGGREQYFGDTEADPEKLAKWDVVWEWFNKYKDMVTLTTSNNDGISRLNQGEIDIVVAWDDNAARTLKSGELFKDAVLYIPEYGMSGGGDTAGIMKNAGHPAASLLFIDYMTSEEGQQLFIDVMLTYPARTDMTTENSLISRDDFVNRRNELPAPYKAIWRKDFTEYVMMH